MKKGIRKIISEKTHTRKKKTKKKHENGHHDCALFEVSVSFFVCFLKHVFGSSSFFIFAEYYIRSNLTTLHTCCCNFSFHFSFLSFFLFAFPNR